MKRSIYMLSILLLFASCDKAPEVAYETSDETSYYNEAPAAKRLMGGNAIMAQQEASIEQKIIRSANLEYEVNSLDSSLKILTGLVAKFNGAVQQEQQHSSYNRLNANLTVRIPAQHFDAFLDAVLSGNDIRRLEGKNISAQDVTEQFIDITSRLQTKQQALTRYRELLQKAETVTDMLSVEENIRRLQEEIESQQARLDYLSTRISMSEVRFSLYETIKTEYIPDKSDAFFPQFLNSLHGGWKGVVNVFYWLIGFWPVWLSLIFIILIIQKRKRENK